MTARLIAENGALDGLVLPLEDGDQWVIGRDPDACQLIVEDEDTSPTHLLCRSTDSGIVVENISKTHPTQINGEEVKEPRLLQEGDVVKIGKESFRFYANSVQPAEPEQEPESIPANAPDAIEPEPTPETKAEQPEVSEQELPEAAEELPPEENTEIETKEPEIQTPDKEEAITPEIVTKEPETQASNKEEETTPEMITKEPTEISEEKALEKESQNLLTDTEASEQPIDEEKHDSIYDDHPSEKHGIAEINFGLLDTGRWLLKAISGPNNGAEFSLQTGTSYVVGTDPNVCDIVFHDTSVSRQHLRISISSDDIITLEDLKSRNGTNVEGIPLKEKGPIAPNAVISIGTTSFVIFDREGEMHTIIAPLLPAIYKTLTEEPKKTEEGAATEEGANPESPDTKETPKEHHHTTAAGAFILISILVGIFVIVGISLTTLFRSEPVVVTQTIDPDQALHSALAPFPSVKYTFNPSTGQLLIVGHVLTASDRSQLLYAIQGLRFIKNLDDSGIVIDEGVWREMNQSLEKNPEWKGVNIMAPTPGHFIVSGYLQKRNQSEKLNEYLSANFPYPDLLEKRVIVDEDVLSSVNSLLQNKGYRNLAVDLSNGEITISGQVPIGKVKDINALVTEIKEIRGVRNVRNLTTEAAIDQSVVNISDKYEVTGTSNQGGKVSVVINGRILMKGDVLDGMTITGMQPSSVLLEKDGVKYRIDFSK